MAQLVVARYQDGRLLKGVSLDIDPSRSTFHVRPEQGPAVEVKLSELKALFFVRSLAGNAAYNDADNIDPSDPRARGSTIVRVRFNDGETVVGITIRYPPNRDFFYVLPVDPKSNNVRILVNRGSVAAIESAG